MQFLKGGFKNPNSALALAKKEVLPTKVGMNLEYCELCEKKLREAFKNYICAKCLRKTLRKLLRKMPISPNPTTAAAHYSSREHLKYLKLDAGRVRFEIIFEKFEIRKNNGKNVSKKYGKKC